MAIIEDYVSFETAKLLKEKGFNEDSWFHYDADGDVVTRGYRLNKPEDIPAWTLQMAMKWLREAHNIAIVLTPSMFWGKYNVTIYKRNNEHPFGFDVDSLISSYEKAAEAAIKYCLENLV